MALSRVLESLKGVPFNTANLLRAFAAGRFEEPLPRKTQALFAILDSGMARDINRLSDLQDIEKQTSTTYGYASQCIALRKSPSESDNKELRTLGQKLEEFEKTRKELEAEASKLIKAELEERFGKSGEAINKGAAPDSQRSAINSTQTALNNYHSKVNKLEQEVQQTLTKLEDLHLKIYREIEDENRAKAPEPRRGTSARAGAGRG